MKRAEQLERQGAGYGPSVVAFVRQIVAALETCGVCRGQLSDMGECAYCKTELEHAVRELDVLREVAAAARPFVKSDVKFASPPEFQRLRAALIKLDLLATGPAEGDA